MAPHVTIAERRVWRQMRKAGATLSDIARLSGRSLTTIERHTSEAHEARQRRKEKEYWLKKQERKHASTNPNPNPLNPNHDGA